MFGNLKKKNYFRLFSLVFFVFVFFGNFFFSSLPVNSQIKPGPPSPVDCSSNVPPVCDIRCGQGVYPVDPDCSAIPTGPPPTPAPTPTPTPAPTPSPSPTPTPTPPPSDPQAAAPTGSGYQVLAPFPGVEGQSPGLTVYLRAVFSVGLGLAVVLAVLMIVIGGIQYMGSESIFSHQEAKSRITAAVLGLLLAFLSWVILQTINPKLLYVGLNVPNIKLQGAQGNQSPEGTPTGPGPTGQCFPGPNCPANWTLASSPSACSPACNINAGFNCCTPAAVGPPPAPGCPATNEEYQAGDKTIRDGLKAVGIEFNKENCSQCGQGGCTSVYGLGNAAVSGVKDLKAACGCDVTITGGTETGHTTHKIGEPIIDLRRSDPPGALENYLIQNDAAGGRCTLGGRRVAQVGNGYYFFEDSAHFHVSYGSAPSGMDCN